MKSLSIHRHERIDLIDQAKACEHIIRKIWNLSSIRENQAADANGASSRFVLAILLLGAEAAGDAVFLQDIVDSHRSLLCDRSIDIDRAAIAVAISSAVSAAEAELRARFDGLDEIFPYEYDHWINIDARHQHESYKAWQLNNLDSEFIGHDTFRYTRTNFPRCNTIYSIIESRQAGIEFPKALIAPIVAQGFGLSLYCNHVNSRSADQHQHQQKRPIERVMTDKASNISLG